MTSRYERACPNCHEPEPEHARSHCGYCDWPLEESSEFAADRADYMNDCAKEKRL